MPVETFTTIDSLNPSNPPASDGLVQGDDHIRGLKSTIKNTFTGITGPTNVTQTTLNNAQAGNFFGADAGGFSFASEPTLALSRSAAGTMAVVGGKLTGNGTCPAGMVADFFTGAIPAGWYELNGQAIPRTGDSATLFAMFGTTYGAGNGTTTFNLPNLGDRFRRQRGTYSLGQTGGNTIASFSLPLNVSGAAHSHVVNVFDPGHGHGVSDPGHAHSIFDPGHAHIGGGTQVVVGSGAAAAGPGLAWSGGMVTDTRPTGIGINSAGTGISINGAGTGISANSNSSGTLSMSGTANYAGASETTPYFVAVVTCIKS
jgi:hypothetical protein